VQLICMYLFATYAWDQIAKLALQFAAESEMAFRQEVDFR